MIRGLKIEGIMFRVRGVRFKAYCLVFGVETVWVQGLVA